MARNFEQESFPSKTPSRWKRNVAIGTAMVTFGPAFGAAGTMLYYKYSESQLPEFPQPIQSAVAAPLSPSKDPLPVAPCRPDPKPNSLGKSEDPQACAEAQEHGEIIIIDFGNYHRPKGFTNDVERFLADETANIVTPSISLKKAPKSVKQALTKSVNESGGCLDNDTDKKELAAKIADRMMPRLRTYDFVVALSPYGNCNEDGGLGEIRGRYADVYSNQTQFPSAIAHEIGHQFGMEHEGKVGRKVAKEQYAPVDIATERDNTLNLSAYLQPNNYQYKEPPNSGTIMGDPYDLQLGDNHEANPIAIENLRKLAGRKTFGKTINLNQSPIAITTQEEKQGAFGLVQLTDSKTDKKYNYLAVVPTTVHIPVGNIRGYTLYLTDGIQSAEIARGGYGYSKITNGEQTIKIKVNQKQLQIATT